MISIIDRSFKVNKGIPLKERNRSPMKSMKVVGGSSERNEGVDDGISGTW